jgi:hypothetical protein
MSDIMSYAGNHMSRRNFLYLLGLGAASALPQCNVLKSLYTRPHETTVRLAEIFEGMPKPQVDVDVYDNNGDRTLLLIGEIHMNQGDLYNDFFNHVKENHKELGLDKIFMEGVYADEEEKDPHYSVFSDRRELLGDEALPYDEFRENDSCGYYRLAKNFDVRGVESSDLAHDTDLADMISKRIWELYSHPQEGGVLEKNPEIEKEILHIQSQFMTAKCTLPAEYPPILSEREFRKIKRTARKLEGHIVIGLRNEQFVNVIDEGLGHDEISAFIVGNGHIETDKHHPGYVNTGALLPEKFRKMGINLVYAQSTLVDSDIYSYMTFK